MILTDREINLSLESGLIGIEPRPGPEAFSSTSVDLTLGNKIRTFKRYGDGLQLVIDPTAPGYSFDQVIEQVSDTYEVGRDGWRLEPGILVLAWSAETVDLKMHGRIAARVEGKSSLARLGLGIHVTAPTIHAGFRGVIQLEMVNHGPAPITLRPGMRICQLIFEQTLGAAEKAWQGQFLNQSAS